jgi:RecA/RadA recombinase
MAKLRKHPSAVELKEKEENPSVARTSSPGINYLFGKNGGILGGYTAMIYGPPKCLKYDTVIINPKTNGLLSLKEAYDTKLDEVFSYNETTKMVEIKKVSDWIDSGIKPIIQTTLKTGRVIESTPEHLFLTESGWKPMETILPGESIAVAENVRPEATVQFVTITARQYIGEHQCYDLTVPGNSNFIANNIVAHNSGKSLFSLAFAGQLHKDDPEAIVLHFDTEFRETIPTWAKVFGIDMNRIISLSTNDPKEIFDYIQTDINAMLQEGAPIKMIIIDSLEMINYPKEGNAESTTNHVIGDASAYLKRAMKAILPIIRRNKIYTILCQHVRANMDPNMAKYKPFTIPGGFALKHSVEYWMLAQKIEAKDTKVFDSEKKDGSGNPIQTGHSIRVKMEENSMGPQNRSVEVALSYKDGIVNQHIEIAELATNMGIVERPNNLTYQFDGLKWKGFDNFALAIKEDPELQKKLIDKIKEVELT